MEPGKQTYLTLAGLFVLAVVRWQGRKKLVLERTADLDKLTEELPA